MFGKFSLVVVLAGLLLGCVPPGWRIPISDDISDELPDLLESLRSQVKPGETSRQEVHERLGQPFISSERRRVEVFRAASGREGALDIVVFIPMAFYTEDVIIYALVLYDDNYVVEAIEWDVYKSWYPDDHHEYLVFDRVARLQAAGFYFIATGWAPVDYFSFKRGPVERTEILLAPASETRNALNTPPPSARCAVLIFFETAYWDTKVFLDGEVISGIGQLFNFVDPYGMVFTKALVVEGEHELRVATVGKSVEFRRKFSCDPGSIYYVSPQFEWVESEPGGMGFPKFEYKGEISDDREPLESQKGWRRLLFYNDKWLGDD